MIEDSIWSPFFDGCDRTKDLLYDICTPGINDLEDVDRILSYDFGPQSIGFGSQSEALQSAPRCQDSSDGEIKSQSAVQMEVDDSDIEAVVKSSFQPINTSNNLNNCEMLEKRDPCTATRNQPAYHMNHSTYCLEQVQIFEDKSPLPSVVPSDQPCSFGLSSKQDHCGETYTSSFQYNTRNPQFQLENRLLPDQMDVGTIRCISNSLYRLARASIQRPNISNLSNGSSKSIFARNSKRFSEDLMDQSIAKLLFYRPLDLATSSSAEAMLLRSGMLIGIPL